jgi:CBS domain-containing protein
LAAEKETGVMKTVADAMTTRIHACKSSERLDRVAKIMWEHGCSEVPVVDDDGFLITMLSDRDVCLCAYTQGKALAQIPVTCAAPDPIQVVRTEDSLDFAHELMRKRHVRCLPVLENTGRLIGLLSISDIIRATSLQGEPRLSVHSIEASPSRKS